MAKSYKYSRSRKPLTLEQARLRMTDLIKKLEKIYMTSNDDNKIIQTANAMAGLVRMYSKLIETTDLLERIENLEEANENRMRRIG